MPGGCGIVSPGTKSHNRLMDRIAGRLRFVIDRKINIEGLKNVRKYSIAFTGAYPPGEKAGPD